VQFKVPQNIDMQDRIIGPLTLGQFMYLVFGGIILYILFSKLVPLGLGIIFFILAVPIGLISFAMAFVKVNDRPFPQFVWAFIQYFSRPRQRIWQHLGQVKRAEPKTVQSTVSAQPPRKSLDAVKINELADILDRPGGSSGQKP